MLDFSLVSRSPLVLFISVVSLLILVRSYVVVMLDCCDRLWYILRGNVGGDITGITPEFVLHADKSIISSSFFCWRIKVKFNENVQEICL